MPVVSLERIESFSAAHRLHSKFLSDEENKTVFGKCNNPNGHGHNYVWKVKLRGEVDEKTGMVYNLGMLKTEMQTVLELVDHKNLDLDVEYFHSRVSTTENLAIYLYESLKFNMREPELLYKVTVEETSKNVFTYKGK